MELHAGVIIIGSLIWDRAENRKAWRKELDLSKKIFVKLPIRYGRKSRQYGVRKGTYTMVFSNSAESQSRFGQGLVCPFKNIIKSGQELRSQALLLSGAEGISQQTISRHWGTISIAINPFLKNERMEEIEMLWIELINSFTGQNGYQNPILERFGDTTERKSITNSLKLNINLDALFNQCPKLDVLLATSNAIKLDEDENNNYPTSKQIAAAIHENDYYEYFLSNRLNSIKTFEDDKISKILKYKYGEKLKPKREHLKQLDRQQSIRLVT